MSKLIISQSPHQLGKNSVKKLMYGVLIALIPTLGFSLYFYGLGALIVILTSVVSCVVFEWLITKYILKKQPSLLDGSAVITGLLLAFNVPSNLPIWIILIGALVAIGIGKMTFGGLGNNPFNPALVGRVFLLISFPVQMTSWPLAGAKTRFTFWYAGMTQEKLDGLTGATPLAQVKETIANGEAISTISDLPSHLEMFYGQMGGSLGEIAAIAILLGGIYMLARKIITWHVPVSTIGTVAIFTGILWLFSFEGNQFFSSTLGIDIPFIQYMKSGEKIPFHMADPIFHLLTGGLLLGAIFMATDYVTSPMSKSGMIVFGVGIGLLTVVIRVFGAYPEGVSFAILIMNALVPLINKYMKPKLFGAVKKKKKK
jgi:electron transport complex protein RnfD